MSHTHPIPSYHHHHLPHPPALPSASQPSAQQQPPHVVHALAHTHHTAGPGHHHHFAPVQPQQQGGQQGGRGKGVLKKEKQQELDSLPSNDQAHYYSPSSPSSSTTPLHIIPHPPGNRSHKLDPGSRFQRKGKMYGWSPSWEDSVIEKRVKKRLRVALRVVGEEEDGLDLDALPMGRQSSTPPPPTTAEDLAPLLALPIPTSYLDLAVSPGMKYTLGSAQKEKALSRTVGDLIDGEMGLLGVLGRLRGVREGVERVVLGEVEGGIVARRKREDADDAEEEEGEGEGMEVDEAEGEGQAEEGEQGAEGEKTVEIAATAEEAVNATPQEPTPMEIDQDIKPVLPSASSSVPPSKPALDSTLLLGTEPFIIPPGSTVTFEAIPLAASDESEIVDIYPEIELSPLQKLFVTPNGLTTTIGVSPNDPRIVLPTTHPSYPQPTYIRLTPETQKQSVLSAFERITELASDCSEYVHRLEEIRERIANIGRARRKVWNVVRERAVVQEGGEVGDGEADAETIRKRLEAEAGTGVETRRRRVAAAAGAGTS